MRDRPRIMDLPTHDLLGDLSDPLTGRPPVPARSVETWLKAAGYYPGATREPATYLYQQYSYWCGQHADMLGHRPMAIEKWGAEMRKFLKAGRANTGIFYYISRTPTSEVSENLLGSTPPSPPKNNK